MSEFFKVIAKDPAGVQYEEVMKADLESEVRFTVTKFRHTVVSIERLPKHPAALSLSFNRSFRTHYTDPAKLETQVLAAVRQALRETLGPGDGQESCLVRIER